MGAAAKKPKIPRAPVDGKYVTVWQGKRLVRVYKSGERLTGRP